MDAQLRGFQIGGARVSDKHCGFVINKGNATANDVLQLISDVKKTTRLFDIIMPAGNATLTCLKEMVKNYAVVLTEASNETLYNDYKIYQGIIKAMDNKNDINLNTIKKTRLIYKPSKAIKAALKNMKYLVKK